MFFVIDTDCHCAYGPFAERRVALEYAGEVALHEDTVSTQSYGLRVSPATDSFLQMVAQPGYFE